MPDLSASHGSETRTTWQEQDPILCRCWAWRHGLMADHVDHHATYERDKAAGRVLDEEWFASLLSTRGVVTTSESAVPA